MLPVTALLLQRTCTPFLFLETWKSQSSPRGEIHLENSFEWARGDVASEQLKHAWFGNNMTVLEVETACAQADEKQQREEEKKGGSREEH